MSRNNKIIVGIVAVLAILSAGFFVYKAVNPATFFGESGIGIGGADQWRGEGSNITQKTTGKGLKLTGLESLPCLGTNSSGVVGSGTCGGSGGGTGNVSTSTGETAGFLAYWTSTNATPALLGKVATGTLSASGPLAVTAGRSVIGGSAAISITQSGSGADGYLSSTDWNTFNNKIGWGQATSTSANQAVYTNAAGKLVSVGTSTPSVTAPITYSGTLGQFLGGVSGNFGCTSASAGVTGCLTGTDWSTFNNKIGWGQATSTSPNQFVYTNANGLLVSAASSSLALPNTALANSTISGISLGSNLNSLSVSGSITGTSYNGSAAVSNWALNMANANTWTALQTFGNASTSLLSTGYASSTLWYGGGLLSTCASGNFLTWTAGQFGCAADQTSAGQANPFAWSTNYGVIAAATTSPLWAQRGLFASSTSQFDQINVGSSTVSTMSTSTIYGNLSVRGIASSSRLVLDQPLSSKYGGTDLVSPGSLSASALIQCNGSGGCSTLGVSTDGTVVQSTGGGSTFTVGALNLSTAAAITGDLPFANLTQGAANTVLANVTGGTADFAALATSSLFAGTAGQVLARTSAGTWIGVATSTNSCGTGITCSYAGGVNTFSVANGAITNVMLANSTISGVALGSNLNAHTVSGSLSGSSYNGSAAVSDWAINLANANTYTAIQRFYGMASTSILSAHWLKVGTTASTSIDTAGNVIVGGTFSGAGLTDCDTAGSSKLLWDVTTGLFSCGTDATAAAGSLSPFATTTVYTGQDMIYPVKNSEDIVFGKSSSTTAPFWWDVSATTTYIGNGGAGSSTAQFGPTGNEWTMGYNGATKAFEIASSTWFGVNNVISIAKATLLTTFNNAVTIAGQLTASAGAVISSFLQIPNGSAPVVDQVGKIALDTTENELLYATSTAATDPAVIKPYTTISFAYSSSTQGMGTTTKSLGPAAANGYFGQIQCDSNSFMRLVIRDGTNRTNDLIASSTVGTVKLTTNNTFTAAKAIRVDIGTTTNIAANVYVGCRARFYYTRN